MATIVKKTMADGTTRYQAVVRRIGKLKKKTCRTHAAAVRWATSTEAKIQDGVELPSADDERRTVSQTIAAYLLAGVLDNLRSAPERRRHLEWWGERIGSVRLRDLSRDQVRMQLAALESGETPTGRPAGPATRRRYLASLRSFLAWAVDSGMVTLNAASGAARKGRDREPDGRVRYLTDEQRERLLVACEAEADRRLAPLVRLALLTGARRGELLGWTWAAVDLKRGLASLAETKGGRPRSVALSTPAVEVLRGLRASRVPGWSHVFAVRPVGRPRFPRDAFERAVEKAGIEDFHFHDLRHCFATMLLSAGATLPELAAALGHRTLSMVARYAHLEKPHAARLVELVAERMNSAAGANVAPGT